ncbi:MAG TPA: radical SAM protein [Desulfosporosinus sp.]
MKILLVRPPRIKQAITLSDFMFAEPLGLEMIYGQLEARYTVEIFDMMVEKEGLTSKMAKYLPDVVGITSLCIDVNTLLNLCGEAKAFNPEITTMVGGTQAFLSAMSFADDSVDYIFEFVDETNLLKLFAILEFAKGDQQETEEEIALIQGIRTRFKGFASNGIKGRNKYLLPNRESTARYRRKYSYFGYKPAAIMEFGTGCAKGCEFCLRWRIEGSEEILIDRDLIRKDLESIKEPTIMLVDNDFFASEHKIRTFFGLVRELKLKKNFIVYASVKGILSYEPFVKEFKELGLKAVLVGYESFNDAELSDYRKKSDTNDNLKAARMLERIGIDVWASFIAHPDWSKEDFKKLRKTVSQLKPQISSINPLTPFPTLPLYDKYKDRLLYASDDYKSWSFGQVMIRPSKLSLRGYYYELLLTNMYVNLVVNRESEMLKRYGLRRILGMAVGSTRTLLKYCRLMINAR